MGTVELLTAIALWCGHAKNPEIKVEQMPFSRRQQVVSEGGGGRTHAHINYCREHIMACVKNNKKNFEHCFTGTKL